MLGAEFLGDSKIEVRQLPNPVCPEDGFVLSVRACGICGSDLRNWASPGPLPGSKTKGHEIAGVIEEIGSRVSHFRIGDRVAVGTTIPCGNCYFCVRGLQHLCTDMKEFARDFQGGFAEKMLIPSQAITHGCVFHIPKGVSFDEATLAEPLSSIYNCQEQIQIQAGDTVVIIGAGPIGCLHGRLAHERGASRVMITDIRESRLEIAKQLGADLTVDNQRENLLNIIQEHTDGRGADAVIVAAPSKEAQSQALNLVRKHGKVVWFGGLPKNNQMTTVNANTVHYKEVTIYGAYGYDRRHYYEALQMIASGRIPAEQFISKRFPLKDIQNAFERSSKGEGIKNVILPSEGGCAQ